MIREIVGYTFKTDTLCVDCAREIAVAGTLRAGSATMWSDCGTTEQIMAEWASLIGIDRMEEHTYDSSEFPKAILHYQVEGVARCDKCGMQL